MKTLKKHGLLDRDFLTALPMFIIPIVLKVIA